jgi:hypothetical protein
MPLELEKRERTPLNKSSERINNRAVLRSREMNTREYSPVLSHVSMSTTKYSVAGSPKNKVSQF